MNQPALSDQMKLFTKNYAIPLPHPPQMNNKGNYIVSLSNYVKWLGEQAEEAGVEVFPGFSASEVKRKKVTLFDYFFPRPTHSLLYCSRYDPDSLT